MKVLILIPCVFKRIFGFDCPGCGAQRAVIALLKGNIHQSFHYYPPLLPIIAVVVYLLYSIYLKKNKHTEQRDFVLYFLITLAIISIVINYSYKIYSGKL